MTDALNRVDVCFIIDTTASMQSFIRTAQQHLLEAMRVLGAESGLDFRIGLVEYRDHPPEDPTFVTRAYPLTADREAVQKVINGLAAQGGGDAPEAVYDGIHDACTKMDWRPGSARIGLLVGDAPPHGAEAHLRPEMRAGTGRRPAYPDRWPEGCPCGLTAHSVAAAAERRNLTLHALCMLDHEPSVRAFTEVARGTGGRCVLAPQAQRVMAQVVETLREDFRDLEFDRRILAAVAERRSLDVGPLAEGLQCPRLQAATSIARLGKRGFLAPYVAP